MYELVLRDLAWAGKVRRASQTHEHQDVKRDQKETARRAIGFARYIRIRYGCIPLP